MKITRRQALHGLAATIAGMSTARFIGSDDVVAQAIAKAKPLNIKVTGVKVWTLVPRSTFVKIYTNQQGLIGLGQAHMTGKEPTVAAAILQLREQLIGRDPTAIEANWEDFYEGVRWRGGPLTAASSVAAAVPAVLTSQRAERRRRQDRQVALPRGCPQGKPAILRYHAAGQLHLLENHDGR